MTQTTVRNHAQTGAGRTAEAFATDERGNVAIIFAIAVLPILGLIGAAIDYSRASSARTSVQAALDSTALMLAKDNLTNLNATQINQKAQAYFNGLYRRNDTSAITVTAAYTPNTGSGANIAMTGAGSMPTSFMKVAGVQNVAFGSQSTATWGNTKLRVAIALDNTGSMADDGKMDALIPAAKSLVDQLSASAVNNGDVYISVIPFATDVNIGTSYKNQLWMDWSQWADNGSIEDGWVCAATNNSFQKKMRCGNIFNNVNNWNGCVMDRAQSYDVAKDAPSTLLLNSYLAADQSAWCPVQMIPLSYNWTSLKNRIDQMVPAGNTNQGIGLAMGWLSLQQTAPFNAPAETANTEYKKIIILMTDGLNTQNRFSTDSSTIDTRQRLLCDNIKADGVTIYAMQVNTSGDPTQSVLQYCASSSDKFYSVTSANAIAGAFSSIAASITKLRLSK